MTWMIFQAYCTLEEVYHPQEIVKAKYQYTINIVGRPINSLFTYR